MIVKPENGRGAVTDLKIATLADAALSDRPRLGEIDDPPAIHEDNRLVRHRDRRQCDPAIVRWQDWNERVFHGGDVRLLPNALAKLQASQIKAAAKPQQLHKSLVSFSVR